MHKVLVDIFPAAEYPAQALLSITYSAIIRIGGSWRLFEYWNERTSITSATTPTTLHLPLYQVRIYNCTSLEWTILLANINIPKSQILQALPFFPPETNTQGDQATRGYSTRLPPCRFGLVSPPPRVSARAWRLMDTVVNTNEKYK